MVRGFVLPLLLAAPLAAGDRAETPELAVALRLHSPSLHAALVFDLKPGWHLYWTNPGDSGLPPEVRWKLPAGWRAEPLPLPVPERQVGPGGVDFLLAGRVVLLARLVPPADWKGGPVAVEADADWLACEAACVPGRARLSARRGETATALSEADFATARAALPRPLADATGLRLGTPRLETVPGRWILTLPLEGPEAEQASAFFPEVPEGFAVDHGGIRVSATGLVVPLIPSGPGVRLSVLRGVLRLKDRGVALAVPVPTNP